MANDKRFSQAISVFHGRITPEAGSLAGYGAIINTLELPVPMPRQLILISEKHKQYTTEEWIVLTPRHKPEEDLYAHIVLALKWEGINLLFFKKLFTKLPPTTVEGWIAAAPQSQYSRRIWFLYEWLMQNQLKLPDLKEGNYVELINEKLQYASPLSEISSRHRIKNNLPGSPDFCPLIHKTAKLEKYITEKLDEKTNAVISGVHKDILLRTSAFLLLKDSKASFTIEGENPSQTRAVRWGRAIGQAGSKPLSKEELLRLQQIVIENSRFIQMGYRTEGGFIGEHDRSTGEPIPDHISARAEDLDILMDGLIAASKQMEQVGFHPVLTATKVAFGFVFIHPFVDGNGRLHRYLIHHELASMRFTPQGIIFPVSAAILERIVDYQKVLESYSHPLLDFIKWKKTPKNNVEVLNETIDYYRYFEATAQAEFLFECVDQTIHKTIPGEVNYLQKWEGMKSWLDDRFQMPDKMVSLLIRFLEQNGGILSKRAIEKEFTGLTDEEVKAIEGAYNSYFG
ncbi:filamentation induced by camp protein fic [Flammeovirgaceae bacterium 311]|nr:filamentation induced by camp protein fic [Flammeovirgaceae bacterium 311]